MHPLQLFQFKPFDYRALNQQFGLPQSKRHGLDSLSENFLTHLQTGFDVYRHAYLMFQPAQKSTQQWSQQRARLNAKGRFTLAEMRRQVKTLQKAGKELAVGNALLVREQITRNLSKEKTWVELEELCSQEDEQKKQLTVLNKQIGSIVQFIHFSSDALLFITQKILPNLCGAVDRALLELREKQGKVDERFYQAYEAHLMGLSEQLLGKSSAQKLSEIGKLQENMFARLACFAVYGHDDVLSQLHQELNQFKKANDGLITHTHIPAVARMNRQAFEEFHRLIAFFGQKEGIERLKMLPWFQAHAIEGMIPMENIITNHGCFIIPTEFKKFIPTETSIPEWLFLGTTIRYWFFRDQFFELARLNTALAEVKQTLEQEIITHDSFLSAHKHIRNTQGLLQNMHIFAKKSRLGWFARLFFGDADQMIERWQTKLSATAKVLDDWQLELNEQFVRQDGDFLLSELTANKHEAVQGVLGQVSRNQVEPELQTRAKAAHYTYFDKTNIVGRFLQKLVKESVSIDNERVVLPLSQAEVSNAIKQCIRLTQNPKLQAAYQTLEALLSNDFPFAEISVEEVEQQLRLIMEHAGIVDIPLARLCEIIAQTYLLAHIKDSANPAFIYAKRWAPQAVELWWKQHELVVTEFLVLMRKLFIDVPQEKTEAQLKDGMVLGINGHERKFTASQILVSIKQFYAMAHEFPQYQDELHHHVRTYLKSYLGLDNHYQALILACTDKSLYLEYSTKRLRYLISKQDYQVLAQEVTFALNPPDEFFVKEWSSIIRQHLSTLKEWDPHLLQLIEKLNDESLAQDYKFMALSQKLKPQLKDAVNCHAFNEKENLPTLMNAYGKHNINNLLQLIRSFIDNYVDNEHGLQIIECILSEELIKTYPCAALKQDFYTLKKRVLLMNQLQEHQFRVEKAVPAGQYADIVDPILALYTRWKTAGTPLEKQECLKVLQTLFTQLGSHIRLQISKLNYQANIDLKTRCLDKLPKDIPIHPDTTFLSVLCNHQEVAYLCWYDTRDRERFLAKQHRNFKAFKKGISLSASDLETLSIYSRLWEHESEAYQSTRAKQMRQTHQSILTQVQQTYQHQMHQSINTPADIATLKRTQQSFHYLRIYQPSDSTVNMQLQRLVDLHLLWFLVDTQTNAKVTEWQSTLFQWLTAVGNPSQQERLRLFQQSELKSTDTQQWFQLWFNVLTNQLLFCGILQENPLDSEKALILNQRFCLFHENSHNKTESTQINQRLQNIYQTLSHALTLPAKLCAARALCDEIQQITTQYSANPMCQKLQSIIAKDGLLIKALNWLQQAHLFNQSSLQKTSEITQERRKTIHA